MESATANVEASFYNLSNVQVTIAAEVALNYITLRGAQQQIAIAEDNLKSMRHTADITRQRLAAGFVSTLDVANADAQVYTTESTIPVFQTTARQSIYALSILLGRTPGELVSELSPTGPIPPVPPQVPVGLPSELLRRRPDIMQAEAQIHSATAQIGVATADLFPKFSLTGAELPDDHRRRLVQGRQPELELRPGRELADLPGRQPDLQRLRAGGAAGRGVRRILEDGPDGSCSDVENALIAFTKEQEHRKALAAAVAANQKAVEVSMQLYVAGNTDFLNVLNAQRSLFATQDALVQSDAALVTDLVSLYKALGGGWEVCPDSAAGRQRVRRPCRPASVRRRLPNRRNSYPQISWGGPLGPQPNLPKKQDTTPLQCRFTQIKDERGENGAGVAAFLSGVACGEAGCDPVVRSHWTSLHLLLRRLALPRPRLTGLIFTTLPSPNVQRCSGSLRQFMCCLEGTTHGRE